jgi:hypothetical protein
MNLHRWADVAETVCCCVCFCFAWLRWVEVDGVVVQAALVQQDAGEQRQHVDIGGGDRDCDSHDLSKADDLVDDCLKPFDLLVAVVPDMAKHMA